MIRIKRINISNFGPIRTFDKEINNIEVFYGDNESGKTAIVDGIIRLLNLSTSSPFNREERRFNGYISMTLDINGRIIELSEEKKRKNIYEMLPVLKKEPNILRFMIVRGGDLALFSDKDKKGWWDRIKSFLVDNPDLLNVRKRILERAKLTPDLKNKIELKRKKEEIERIIKEIEVLKIEMENIRNKERRLKDINTRINELKAEYGGLKRAEEYEIYERALKTFNRWRASSNRLKDYERYKHEYLEKWEDKVTKLSELRKEERGISGRLDEREKNIGKLKEDVEKENKLIEEEKALLKELEDKDIFRRVEGLRKKKRWVGRMYPYILPIFGFGIIMGISGIIFYILKYGTYGIFIFLLGGGLILLSGFIKNRMNSLEKEEEEIKKILLSMRVDIGDISSFPTIINRKRIGIEEKIRYKDDMRMDIENKMRELEVLKSEKEEIERKIKIFNRDIEELRSLTGLSEERDLIEKLKEKELIEKEGKDAEESLIYMFGKYDPVLWEDSINKLSLQKPDKKPDPVKLKRVEREIENKKAEKEDIESEIREIKDIKLKILGFSSLKEAYEKEEELKEELKELELKEKGGRLAIEVIDSISKDMDFVIRSLLTGDKKSISQYFNNFTGGRYKEVRVKRNSRGYEIYGVDFEGKEFSAPLLSSGTQDQLFLAFRIPFLKRILGSPAFLILDDAFLSSDYKRRKNLIFSMKGLVEEGWQIIYFTMDKHTIDLFRDICGIGFNKIS